MKSVGGSKVGGAFALTLLALMEWLYAENIEPSPFYFEAIVLFFFVFLWLGVVAMLARRESVWYFLVYTVTFLLLTLSVFPMRF